MKRRTRRKIKRKRSRQELKSITQHHNIAKALGGQDFIENLYMLTMEHHECYHKLFGLLNFEQAAEALLRMQELHDRKGFKRGECE